MKIPRDSVRYLFASILAALGLVGNLPAQTAASADAPVITVQPATQTALAGTNPYLNVSATGAAPLKYVWKINNVVMGDGLMANGVGITGANTAELAFKHADPSVAGNYTVTISNAAGSVTSNIATLKIVSPAADNPPALPSIPDTVFNITTYGAKADGTTDSTQAIQSAINAAAANGGIVKFPAAEKPYLSGPLVVHSNINLQIDGGATLQLLPFTANATTPAYGHGGANFITNTGTLQNFAITGQGVIDGQGAAWWAAFRTGGGGIQGRRPYLIRFSGCDKVLVSGITMMNSPMFHLAFSGNNVTAVGLTIHAPGNSPNTDAIDPGGQHILIQNCNLSIGDDNVAVKAGGIFCSDITIANCTIGEGHGVSVGGQSNRGLDGMMVKDCVFNGTTSGLRLKADATQGGMVQNITYSNLTMTNVQYPIVFYSYYKQVGSPGSLSDSTHTSPEKVNQWNASPPNPLNSQLNTVHLSGWRNITINNLTSTGAKAYNIIWGLPLPDYLIANVTLHNVHLSGGPGFEIYDATNVQVTGDSDIGTVTSSNALAIIKQPENQTVNAGANATFTVTTAGASGVKNTAPKYQWNFNGAPVTDGTKPDGAIVSGSTNATLSINNVHAAQAGSYTVTVSNSLDGFDVNAGALAPESIPVAAISSAATLTIK